MIYAIFLRGINTGGLKLMMNDFKSILHDAGCTNVTTIQAAGTAVFYLNHKLEPMIKADIETRLSILIGKPISSLVRSYDEVSAIVNNVEKIKSPDDCHDYIMLTGDEALFAEIAELHRKIPFTEGERLINGAGYFLWTIRKGDTLAEFGSKILGAKKYRDRLTSRNLNTMQRVAAVMKEMEQSNKSDQP